MSSSEDQPLLQNSSLEGHSSTDDNGGTSSSRWHSWGHSWRVTTRKQIRRFLNSKYGHYAVLLLVSLDVSCIFADFLISLYICDQECDKDKSASKYLPAAQDALGIVSIVFSCLFMVELFASIWAFGFEYFKSWFHCFDATIIVAGFIIDVCLSGLLEEAGSIVVILRLWRVFKIVEEFSAGASDRMDAMNEEMEKLEKENQDLKREIKALKANENRQ